MTATGSTVVRGRELTVLNARGVLLDAPGPGAKEWHPTLADLVRFETGLRDAIRRYPRHQRRHVQWRDDLAERIDPYVRQYAAVISRGKRLLVVQLSCAYEGRRWAKEWIRAKDGGDCFVRVTFDVGARQYVIETHGDA